MALEFQFVVGNRNPPLRLQFLTAEGMPINLSDAVVTAYFQALKRNGGRLAIPMEVQDQTGDTYGCAIITSWSGGEFLGEDFGPGHYHLWGVADFGGAQANCPNGNLRLNCYVGEP